VRDIPVVHYFQPEVGSFVAFDHITFWVGNAKQVSINGNINKVVVHDKFANQRNLLYLKIHQ